MVAGFLAGGLMATRGIIASMCAIGLVGGLFSYATDGADHHSDDVNHGGASSSLLFAARRQSVQTPVWILDQLVRKRGQRIAVGSRPLAILDDHALLRLSNSTYSQMSCRQSLARDWVRRLPKVPSSEPAATATITRVGVGPVGNASDHRQIRHKLYGIPELKWGWGNLEAALVGVTADTPVVVGTAFDMNWGFFSADVRQRGSPLEKQTLCGWTNFTADYLKTTAERRSSRSAEPAWATLARVLDNPDVKIVFASSSSQLYHPKVVLSPLGERMVGGYHHHEWDDLWKEHVVPILNRPFSAASTLPADRRDILVYADHPNRAYREELMNGCLIQRLGDKLVVPTGRVGHVEHYTHMLRAKFTLSLPGLGVDCYRTWEAIRAGSIPILLAGLGLEGLMAGLPVLWVDDYTDVNVEMLERAHRDILSRVDEYDYGKTTVGWWEAWFSRMEQDPNQIEAFLRQFQPVPKKFARNYARALTQRWIETPAAINCSAIAPTQ